MSWGTASWQALGTGASVLVTEPDAVDAATAAVTEVLADIDLACSRFRPDAEVARVHGLAGASVRVSPLLADAVEAALEAARWTDGLVDPTVGEAVIAAGYDRDFAGLPDDGPARPPVPAPGWRTVRLERDRRVLQLAPDVQLDLGATAKALAADRAARAAAAAVAPHGVLVSLGGDIAVAGACPPGGWPVGIADGHDGPPVQTTVSLRAGGLATSSTTQRRWRRGGREAHHIIDPRTGAPADVVWRTVSVAAASCLCANAASTAAIVLGEDAPAWLTDRQVPARLVRADGHVVTTCGWVADGMSP